MKPYRTSLIYNTKLSTCSSRTWSSTSTETPRCFTSHHRARNFSGTILSKSSKRCPPSRAAASAASPASTRLYTKFSVYPLIPARYASNQSESSSLSPSPQSTTITPSATEDEKFNPLINPISATLSPPLHVPERKSDQLYILYLYSRGRAYLNFFKSGLRNVWTMRRIARDIKKTKQERQQQKNNSNSDSKSLSISSLPSAATSNPSNSQHLSLPLMTRAEFQVLRRNDAAISKVLPFGLFIFVFAEFSPILLLYVTSIVPEPCQLPSVQAKIENKFNKRKFKSFVRYKEHIESTERGGDDKLMLMDGAGAGVGAATTPIPSALPPPTSTSAPQRQESESTTSLLTILSTPTLQHASTAIKAHPAILDHLSYIPVLSSVSSLIMTRNYLINRIRKRLLYLRTDDALLLRDGSVEELSPQELKRAVAERGYLAETSLGVSHGMRTKQLKEWLGRSVGMNGKAGGENGLLRLILDG